MLGPGVGVPQGGLPHTPVCAELTQEPQRGRGGPFNSNQTALRVAPPLPLGKGPPSSVPGVRHRSGPSTPFPGQSYPLSGSHISPLKLIIPPHPKTKPQTERNPDGRSSGPSLPSEERQPQPAGLVRASAAPMGAPAPAPLLLTPRSCRFSAQPLPSWVRRPPPQSCSPR